MLSKRTAYERTNEQVDAVVKSAEAEIDRRLSLYVGDPITIDYQYLFDANLPTAVRDKAVAVLIGRYSNQGGWTVTPFDSQLDGNSLVFK